MQQLLRVYQPISGYVSTTGIYGSWSSGPKPPSHVYAALTWEVQKTDFSTILNNNFYSPNNFSNSKKYL